MEEKYLTCPFCGESDFDGEGLKYHHLLAGNCDKFNAIENTLQKERMERIKQRELKRVIVETPAAPDERTT